MDFYKTISAWYDQIFPFDGQQKEFVLAHMNRHAGHTAQNVQTVPAAQSVSASQTGSILDIGCATGSLLISLAPFFPHAAGLDLDGSLITQAKHKAAASEAAKNVSFIEENMMNIDSSVPFSNIGTALCMGNTLPHLTNPHDLLFFFKTLHSKMASDGVFMFQIINFDRVLSNRVHSLPILNNQSIKFERFYSDPDDDGNIDFSASLTVHAENRTAHSSVTLRPYTRETLQTMLQSAGFTSSEWYGSFSAAPWTAESFLTIGVCRT